MIVHCLFEQSGTFKNEFIKLGLMAFDYDIQNKFNQTDFVVDILQQIEYCYMDKPSLFDSITSNDLIMAFFPCTYFECQSQLIFNGNNYSMRNYSDIQKLEISMSRHYSLNRFYSALCKLAIICKKRNLRIIIENPYQPHHYLTYFWCLKPTIIDLDRTLKGDYYKKPTQYWFINIKPKNNLIFEALDYVDICSIAAKPLHGIDKTTARSMIHPQYANRFIREYIL